MLPGEQAVENYKPSKQQAPFSAAVAAWGPPCLVQARRRPRRQGRRLRRRPCRPCPPSRLCAGAWEPPCLVRARRRSHRQGRRLQWRPWRLCRPCPPGPLCARTRMCARRSAPPQMPTRRRALPPAAPCWPPRGSMQASARTGGRRWRPPVKRRKSAGERAQVTAAKRTTLPRACLAYTAGPGKASV